MTAEESARLHEVLRREGEAHHTAPTATAVPTTEALETTHHRRQCPAVADHVLMVIDANLSIHVLSIQQHPDLDIKTHRRVKTHACRMG